MSTKRTHDGWELREAGSADGTTVLYLPGALCSAEVYEDLLADPALAPFHNIATTVPGWGRTTPPDDVSIENYARLVGKVAADLSADVMVGHSWGANVAIEAAALGTFKGPIVPLSPSFSRKDEVGFLSVLDRLGRIPGLGRLVWSVALKGASMDAGKRAPEDRREALKADLGNNDPLYCKRNTDRYFAYLDHYRSVAERLCSSGSKACVVFGDNDEIKLQDDERRVLEGCATVKLTTVKGTHMFPVENPSETASVIAEAAGAVVKN